MGGQGGLSMSTMVTSAALGGLIAATIPVTPGQVMTPFFYPFPFLFP